MFRKLVETLFPSFSGRTKANVFYFEDTRKNESEEEVNTFEPGANDPINFLTAQQKHQLAFYDCLFGESSLNRKDDELSQFVAQRLEMVLTKPASLLKSLPILPASLSKVLDILKGDDFDVAQLVETIEQEPAIAAKVIELANSSYYKRGEKPVEDLKSAFMGLGRDGLVEGVINGFISKMTPQAKVYFKQYGEKIWKHSFDTGVITKQLLKNAGFANDSPQGYLIGLICNLGDMIIYQLMTDAFAVVHPDCQPDSWAFKNLMITHSRKLTCQMAKYWNLPDNIVKTLVVQAKLTSPQQLPALHEKYPLACYIYESNLLSELEFRFNEKQFDAQTLEQMADKLLYSNESKQYVQQMFETA